MQALDIGFVGLGVMGAPMTTHLARAGHRLRILKAPGDARQPLNLFIAVAKGHHV
jgi:3-hydroxyisobutyrate dehydrogenase-like beta-hydroxyacid dehydrogenase